MIILVLKSQDDNIQNNSERIVQYIIFFATVPYLFKNLRNVSQMIEKLTEYDPNSGLVPVEGADSERLKKSRVWNIVEPIAIYAFVLIVIWVSGLEADWIYPVFGVLVLWVLFISPYIHFNYEKEIFLREDQRNFWFYFFECRGLGSARKYFFEHKNVNDGSTEKPYFKKYFKINVIMITLIVIVGVLTAVWYNDEYSEYLLDAGIEPTPANQVIAIIVLIPIVYILLFIAFSVMVRYDTLKKSFKHLAIIIAIGIPYVFMFNILFTVFPDLPYITGDSAVEKLASFNFIRYCAQFSGYIFWGYAQQLLFLGIFNTMLCRGFDIRKPSGQIWVSFITSMFFGLIHLPVFWLSFFTWFGGFFWSLYYIRSRNLWSMGITHGALATLLNQLTPVPFSVGPKVVM